MPTDQLQRASAQPRKKSPAELVRGLAESDQGWGVISSPSVRREGIKVKSESRAARVAPESPDHTELPRVSPSVVR